MKRKITNLTSIICYALQSLAGLVLAIVMYFVGIGSKEQGAGKVLLVLISTLFLVIGLIYFVVGIIPLVLRILSLLGGKRKLTIACMVFDVIYIAVSAIMLACSAVAGAVGGIILFAILALVSGVSLGMNIVATDKRAGE